MNRVSFSRQGNRRTWTAPLLLALITLSGLLCALLGEQIGWKVTAWIALGTPVFTAIRFAWPPRS
jgi:hypothetical protein